MRDFKKLLRDLKGILAVTMSAFVYSIAIKIFVTSADLFPAGFSGISQLIMRIGNEYFHVNIPFSLLYLALNIGPTILVYRHIGRKFTLLSVLQYLLVSLFVAILPQVQITEDIFLIAVFGGILAGIGNSIALTNNASTGGTDFIAIYASNKYNIVTWNYVMAVNACIYVIAGFLFGWDKCMYSIIYQFCNTTMVKQFHNRYQLRTLFIVTDFPNEVSTEIFGTCRHGITKFWCEGEYSHKPKSFLYMTCNAFQVNEIIHAAKVVDPHCFINILKTEKVVGNYYQQPLD